MNKRKLFYILGFLLIAAMLFAACGGGGTTGTTGSTGGTGGTTATEAPSGDTTAAAETIPFKNPDTYVVVTFGDPETLDPAWTYETAGSAVENNIYEGLIWFNKDRTDEFVPMLATDWTVNDTGDVWTFNIRQGVTFHEGGTLEPHDVAYSMWRALLQDRIDGPHWMTHEIFFGTYSMARGSDLEGDPSTLDLASAQLAADNGEDAPTELMTVDNATPEQLQYACEYVKSAIVADDAAGTVTYNLAKAAPWFLAVMANPFGAVVDQEWMAANGDWDGNCDDWTQYYDPAAEDTILFDAANGTGPYKLDHWTPGEEIVMVRNENYWRAADDPIWDGGPSGIASIQRIVRQNVTEWGTRLAMFEAGDADTVTADPQYYSQLEPMYGEVYCFEPDNPVTCPVSAGGWIHVYSGYQTAAMTPAQFNWQINSEGGNVFQGSGQLDGNGIPDDFFQDVHIRRAFSYCMDYDTLISEALDGQGAQAQGPIIAGMMGYRSDGYMYSYDPEKCAEEFQAASTDVWGTGFYMQIAYNTGNDTRRLAAEILKAGVEAVNPKFQITVVGMPWPVLLNARRASKLPIYVGGWLEDFHDPHNWVQPFLYSTGAYGRVVNMTEPDKSMFDNLINEAAALTDPEQRRPIYEEIQLKAEEEAVDIWLYQPVGRIHFTPWIQGWYFNSAYSSTQLSYVYALSKVGP